MLPIEIDPAPGELARVGLVLKECRELDVDEAVRLSALPTPEWTEVVSTPLVVEELAYPPGEAISFPLEPDNTIPWRSLGSLSGRARADGKTVVLRRERTPVAVYLADVERRLMSLVFEDARKGALHRAWTAPFRETVAASFSEWKKRLRVFDMKSKKVFELPMESHCSEIGVSEDGTRAAWANHDREEGERVTVLDLASREVRHIVSPVPDPGLALAEAGCPFPRTEEARFRRCPRVAGRYVWLLDIEEENIVNVSSHPARDGDPCVARNGRLVLFSSARDRGGSIYLADTETKTLVRVAEHGSGAETLNHRRRNPSVLCVRRSSVEEGNPPRKLDRVLASDAENIPSKGSREDGRRILVRWIERSTRRTRTCLIDLP